MCRFEIEVLTVLSQALKNLAPSPFTILSPGDRTLLQNRQMFLVSHPVDFPLASRAGNDSTRVLLTSCYAAARAAPPLDGWKKKIAWPVPIAASYFPNCSPRQFHESPPIAPAIIV